MKQLSQYSIVFISLLVILAYQNCSVEGLHSLGSETSKNNELIDSKVPIEQRVGPLFSRRLTNFEYDQAVKQLLGETGQLAFNRFPSDITLGSFDTNANDQGYVGAPSVQAYEELAMTIAENFVKDANRRTQYIPCQPQATIDSDCSLKFIKSFVTKAFSRQLSNEETNRLLEFTENQASEANSFYTGIEALVAAVLQMPEFIYFLPETETVDDFPGLKKLSATTLAKKLSLAITSSLPSEELLAAAANGELDSKEGVIKQAKILLDSDLALETIQRFHSIWLNYHELSVSQTLATEFTKESNALIKKVLWDDQAAWSQLFTYNKTYINQTLANHYNLPSPGTNYQWVNYNAGRLGLLSHGSTLASGVNFGDTSPVQRGKYIVKYVLCRDLPPPPPNVNADNPPPDVGDNCKITRYKAYAPPNSSCFACHQITDPVGFGLEQYDSLGQFRTTEKENTSCLLDGQGSIQDYKSFKGGAFSGPAELAQIITTSGEVQQCMLTKLYEYTAGRKISDSENYILSTLSSQFSQSENFKQIFLDLVSSTEFRYVKADN